ncbi:MAG TPA: TPM domain-containing protein [Bryobacteraceae bacterium]|nr:TPM domain-containing protein [Bryobacteraceae bacterium]
MKTRLRLAALLGICACSAPAVDWKTFRPQGYVSDFAGVIDASSRAQLDNYCGVVERSTGAQIALVTLPSLEGEPIEDVANEIFHAWGVGQKSSNEGIMLLLAIGDRRSRLEVGYGLEPALPDGLSGSILRQMAPALRQQQYGEAMMAAAETIGATIAHAKNVSLTATLPRTMRPTTVDTIPWPLLIGGVFLFLWLLRAGGAYRGYGYGYGGGPGGFLAGMILGSMLNSGGRSGMGGLNSGGGFGGFDSGGGFGGFGGGDSGGGGASGGW